MAFRVSTHIACRATLWFRPRWNGRRAGDRL